MSEATTARIAGEGMGGAFEPPNHPAYRFSVETDLEQTRDNRGCMSLEYATSCEYLPEDVRARAQQILDEYTPPPITTPEVQEWIRDVMRHWRGCYKGEGEQPYNVDQMHIHQPARGARPPRVLGVGGSGNDTFCSTNQHPLEERADVQRIRRYYPDWVPPTPVEKEADA